MSQAVCTTWMSLLSFLYFNVFIFVKCLFRWSFSVAAGRLTIRELLICSVILAVHWIHVFKDIGYCRSSQLRSTTTTTSTKTDHLRDHSQLFIVPAADRSSPWTPPVRPFPGLPRALDPFTITAAPSICLLTPRRELAGRKSDAGAPPRHNKGPFKRSIFRTTWLTGAAWLGQRGASRNFSPAEGYSKKTVGGMLALNATFRWLPANVLMMARCCCCVNRLLHANVHDLGKHRYWQKYISYWILGLARKSVWFWT